MISATRAANMEQRRQRIMSEARSTLARDGFDALTVRNLADRAGVTVPTLYNLVGSKEDLLRLLIEGLVRRCERELEKVDDRDPIVMTQRVFTTLASIFAEDEDFCRAALLAGQRLERGRSSSASLGIWRRSSQIAMRICLNASEAGLLRGHINPRHIGERAFDSYRIAATDWMNAELDTAEFERNALSGFYLCLAADAVPRFRKALVTQLEELVEA